MPITRSELIARSLVHANKMTSGTVSLPALVDHNHFNHLSPEEKAAVIQHYAELTRGEGSTEEQGHLSTIISGARKGVIASIIPAMASTALTLPTLMAIRAAAGNKMATMDILRRTMIPAGLIAGIGAGSGIFSEYMERANAYAQNRNIGRMLKEIHEEDDPEEKQVKSMSLVATAPYLNRTLQATENVGANVRAHLINKYTDPRVLPHQIDEIIGRDTYYREDGQAIKPGYRDWQYVRSVPMDKLIPKELTKGKSWEIREIN